MARGAHVELLVGDGGQVTIYGEHPVRGGEYEYSVTIAATDVPALAAALGTTVDGIRAAWDQQCGTITETGEPRWLREHGVRYEFASWMTEA